ncbi:MAG: class I SAM-dependent methyltransferase [Euryarchaeota archaeon]|nr:class I SAM-dependent methyltransferase [Euryarchaeota archaeon]
MKIKAKIKGPIFIGRSWAEYLKFFDLNEEFLKDRKVLDCAAGASSFTANMNSKGYDVTAVDILYERKVEFLREKCVKHLNILIQALYKIEGHFVWSFFKGLEDLRYNRMIACREFSQDYKKNQGKTYIKANLGNLPFKDNSFDLVLCSHLLFIYDHRLSYRFHINSIREMLRVSSDEIRIYPLVKEKGEKSLFLDQVINEIREDVEVEIVGVDYEFRRGGNEMMKISLK